MSSFGLDDEMIKTIKESKIDAAKRRRFATERSSVAVLHGIHGKHETDEMHQKP